MLTCLFCNPEIVPWNRPAFGREFTSQRGVVRGRDAINGQRRKFLFDYPKPLLITRPVTLS